MTMCITNLFNKYISNSIISNITYHYLFMMNKFKIFF